MSKTTGVILAAGKGVRMRSRLAKVLHPVAGIPMISHVVSAAQSSGIDRLVVVVGHGREQVVKAMSAETIQFVVQEEQLGTGHALLQAEAAAEDSELIIVLCGDTPLLRAQTLEKLIRFHRDNQASATVLTAELENPEGYGRIIRDDQGDIVRIVEEKDATPQEREIREINSGIYCFDREVFRILKNLNPDNAQGEYYLTDVLLEYRKNGRRVLALLAAQEEDIYGINDRAQLAFAERILRQRKCLEVMLSGVTILDPATTFIDAQVKIGSDTTILPFTMIEGQTVIGENCVIGPGARIISSRIGDRVTIDNSKIIESQVGDGCDIGPYAYLRPGTELHQDVKVGDFVEVKKSVVGSGSKIPHLAYVGDATIGCHVNVGAGTITCNYDGEKKHPTIIEDGAFIGSNTNLVAPVRIGEKAVTGAGSTITRDVPPFSLGVERAPQKVIDNWRHRKKKHNDE
ncbi:MAG: bifunctional UDP-N-acetylglucosamine diphosphorylase/glucosamine-1-phosphate N-acetyltransferase GlmU [Syntrophomonadaceae bacterium]|nr:bifunctional UDP-N-acetylglucosamine diphosphorylase/glucosamine-1-phosphate N-acetyltransferase GlmU [Syntrophomonadaceae bacterium]